MVKDGFRPTEKNYIGVDELNPHPAYSLSVLFFKRSEPLSYEIKLEVVC